MWYSEFFWKKLGCNNYELGAANGRLKQKLGATSEFLRPRDDDVYLKYFLQELLHPNFFQKNSGYRMTVEP